MEDGGNVPADEADDAPPQPPDSSPRGKIFKEIHAAGRKIGVYQNMLLRMKLTATVTKISRPIIKNIKERHEAGEVLRADVAAVVAVGKPDLVASECSKILRRFKKYEDGAKDDIKICKPHCKA